MPHTANPRAWLLAALLALPAAAGAEPSREDLDKWFNAPMEKSAADVNEGELKFLAAAPAKPVHHHHNLIVIADSTLRDGWARLIQCHQNLDRVPAAQIMFSRERTRELQITYQHGIGRAWVEGNSVQLTDVGPGAWLCISAASRALHDNLDGTWSLKNGPFMRKFLDGYYPMHVSMDVFIESPRIRFDRIQPAAQTGFRVWQTPGEVSFDAWFEGRLSTELRFSETAAGTH
jgi:hypothetical protein